MIIIEQGFNEKQRLLLFLFIELGDRGESFDSRLKAE
jgi:hypothetical protein